MRVLVIGSKDWENVDGLTRELDRIYETWLCSLPGFENFEVVHRNAPVGADQVARVWAAAKRTRDPKVVHWSYPLGPVLRDYVDQVVVATREPSWRTNRLIRMARRRSFPLVEVLHDDGRWTHEDIAIGKAQAKCDLQGIPYPPEVTSHLQRRMDQTEVKWADE